MEAIVQIEEALAFTPKRWTTAQRSCEDLLELTSPLYEPGPLKRVDKRVDELAREVQQLQRALKARDSEVSDSLLASIRRMVQALAAESSVV